MARPLRKRAPVVRWPYDKRVDAAHAWGTVASGLAVVGVIVTVLATLDGSHPHFRWWWPTSWMIAPVGIVVFGLIMVMVPLRRHEGEGATAPPVTAPPPVISVSTPTGSGLDSPRHGPQSYEIGGGEPGWKGPFQRAWSDLMNEAIWIGDPASDVCVEGPGVVQYFESHLSLFGWVLCALPHQRPVAVAGEVWQALQAVGAGVPGGDALGAVGFPVPAPQATRRVNAQAVSIDLTGGRWEKGRLLRDADGSDWRWEPVVRFGMDMTRAAGYWTADRAPQQLRLRAVASLPWADASELAVTSQRRLGLERALPISELAELVSTLSRHRGADLRAAGWNRGPNRNALDAFSYSSVITAPDNRTAMAAEVMMALPSTMNSSVVTCAELRIEDLTTWTEALAASGARPREDLRLSMEEVTEFFAVAWQTATEILATVVTDNEATMLWADPPTVELRLSAERRYDNTAQPQPMLDDYIDMHPLGRSDRANSAKWL